MRWNGKEIATLAEDDYEAPELWAILWQAILARDDQQGAQSDRPVLHGPARVADTNPAVIRSHAA